MKPKSAILLGAAGVACVLIVVAITSLPEAGTGGGSAAGATDGSGDGERAASVPPARPPAIRTEPPGDPEAEDSSREALAGSESPDEAAPAREVSTQRTEILVLDGIAEVPLPGARVLWLGTEEVNAAVEGQRVSLDSREDLAIRLARESFTDGAGIAEVGLDETGGFLRAEHGGLARTLWTNPAPRAFENTDVRRQVVRLFPERRLEIQVLDESGAPRSGVQVCLRVSAMRRSDGLQGGGDEMHLALLRPRKTEFSIWRGSTGGPSGLAAIEDFDEEIGHYYQSRDSESSVLTDVQLWVDLDLPDERSAAALLDTTVWDLPRVVLRLPATGSLTMRLLDDAGRPAALEARVRLFTVADANAESPRPDGRWSTSGVLTEGSARFEAIELDQSYGVDVRFRDGRPPVVMAFSGPTSAQPERTVELGASPPRVLIEGTLLDVDGAPLASTWVSVTETTAGGEASRPGHATYPVRTDARGAFETPLRTLSGPGERCTVLIRHPHTPSDEPIEAALVVTGASSGGRVSLGVLRLAAPED